MTELEIFVYNVQSLSAHEKEAMLFFLIGRVAAKAGNFPALQAAYDYAILESTELGVFPPATIEQSLEHDD